MNKIIECVPNFSEGRDKEKIEKIVECFRGKDNVKLLDYSNDENHNRRHRCQGAQELGPRTQVREPGLL